MATRQIQHTTTQTVTVCDLCSKDDSLTNWSHCFICGGDFCWGCLRMIAWNISSAALSETSRRICCRCLDADRLADGANALERIRQTMNVANEQVAALLAEWRAVAAKAKGGQ